MTEIFRAGLQSIGYGRPRSGDCARHDALASDEAGDPAQAIRIIIPDVGNQFIAMQKDSALVSVMGVWEITYIANRYARRRQQVYGNVPGGCGGLLDIDDHLFVAARLAGETDGTGL